MIILDLNATEVGEQSFWDFADDDVSGGGGILDWIGQGGGHC